MFKLFSFSVMQPTIECNWVINREWSWMSASYVTPSRFLGSGRKEVRTMSPSTCNARVTVSLAEGLFNSHTTYTVNQHTSVVKLFSHLRILYSQQFGCIQSCLPRQEIFSQSHLLKYINGVKTLHILSLSPQNQITWIQSVWTLSFVYLNNSLKNKFVLRVRTIFVLKYIDGFSNSIPNRV